MSRPVSFGPSKAVANFAATLLLLVLSGATTATAATGPSRSKCNLQSGNGCIKFSESASATTGGWLQFCPFWGRDATDSYDGSDKGCVSLKPFRVAEYNKVTGESTTVRDAASGGLRLRPNGAVKLVTFSQECSSSADSNSSSFSDVIGLCVRPSPFSSSSDSSDTEGSSFSAGGGQKEQSPTVKALSIPLKLDLYDSTTIFVTAYLFLTSGEFGYGDSSFSVSKSSFKFDIQCDSYRFQSQEATGLMVEFLFKNQGQKVEDSGSVTAESSGRANVFVVGEGSGVLKAPSQFSFTAETATTETAPIGTEATEEDSSTFFSSSEIPVDDNSTTQPEEESTAATVVEEQSTAELSTTADTAPTISPPDDGTKPPILTVGPIATLATRPPITILPPIDLDPLNLFDKDSGENDEDDDKDADSKKRKLKAADVHEMAVYWGTVTVATRPHVRPYDSRPPTASEKAAIAATSVITFTFDGRFDSFRYDPFVGSLPYPKSPAGGTVERNAAATLLCTAHVMFPLLLLCVLVFAH